MSKFDAAPYTTFYVNETRSIWGGIIIKAKGVNKL